MHIFQGKKIKTKISKLFKNVYYWNNGLIMQWQNNFESEFAKMLGRRMPLDFNGRLLQRADRRAIQSAS